MTCPTCQTVAATTRAQLDNRLRDLREFQAGFQKRPQCGGTDWGTTEDFIQPTTAPLRAPTGSKSEHDHRPDFMTILFVGLGLLGIVMFFLKIMGATVH